MDVASALLLMAAMGVNSGWQPVGEQPASHTARYESQDAGWSGDERYNDNSYNTAAGGRYQYNPPAAATSQPPTITRNQSPTVTSRVQGAAVETGTTLRDGVEAGIQAAGQQFERAGGQILDRSMNVGQGVDRQLQDLTTGAGRQLQYTGDNLRNVAGQTLGAAGDTFGAAGRAIGVGSTAPTGTSGSITAPSASPWTPPAPTPWPMDAFHAENAVRSTSTAGSGWTSLGPDVAPPPLLNPPLPAAATSATATTPFAADRYPASPATPSGNDWGSTWSASAASTTPPELIARNVGAGSADPAASGRTPLHSVLTDPAASNPPSSTSTISSPAGGWATGWDTTGSNQPTIGRSSDATSRRSSDLGLVPVRPAEPRQQDQAAAADRWANPWSEADPWNQPPEQPSQPAADSTTAAPAGPSFSTTSSPTLDGWGVDPGRQSNVSPAAGPAPTNVGGARNQPPAGPPAATNGPVSTNVPALATGGNSQPQMINTEQPPWMPLLLVSFGLAGSLGANLFLGWSYMDARQRYRSLARKTADSFKRVKDALA